MPTLDSRIDDLYQRPLAEFVAARTTLAKTLDGADAARVRRLTKPSLVAWTVNQLYWKARPLFDRLMKKGQELRAAQIAALKGRTADVRAATEAHRAALTAAVQKGAELAGVAGSHPSSDVLARMLEALSLSSRGPDHPGRLTEVIRPAGFEALSGIVPAPTPLRVVRVPEKGVGLVRVKGVGRVRQDPADKHAEERLHAREEAARQRKAQATIKAAERELARAQAAEARARQAADTARERTEAAKRNLATARLQLPR